MDTLPLPVAVFRVFDQDNDTCVNADEWVKGLSTFLRGSMEDKMKCKLVCFKTMLLTIQLSITLIC